MTQPGIAIDLILSKLAEDAEKARTRAEKAPEVLLGPLETEIATTPCDIVMKKTG